MRITTLTLAASLAFGLTGAAFAQGMTVGNGAGAATTGSSSPAAEAGRAPADSRGASTRATDNPAGVIDGTNPNPNPTQAGGIRSPERAGTVVR